MTIVKPITSSLSSSIANSLISKSSILTDFLGGAIGDSTAERMFTQFTGAGEAAFEAEAANYYAGTVDYYDAANSGTYLLESTALSDNVANTNIFWVDDSGALAAGPQFTNNVTNDSNDANCYICSLGINDNPEITTTSTTATEIENAFDFIADTAVSSKGVSFVMLNTLGRDAGGDNVGCNIIREGTINAINNNANIKRGVDTYDLERADNKHLVQAGDEEKGEREAIQSAYYFGNSSIQALGPRVTSASLIVDEITLNLSHVGGTDITAPTSGNGGMDATDDGTAMGATALTRVNATTAKLTFPEAKAPVDGSTVKVFVPYGRDGGLAANPDVMRDNTASALPIQSDIITATNNDVIQALDNMTGYFDSRGSVKTYSAGALVSSIDTLKGVDASCASVGATNPTFSTDHLNFAPASQLVLGASGEASSVQTIVMVFEVPTVITADNLFAFSNGTATDNQARAVTAGDDRLYWALNESSVSEQISDILTADTKYFVMFEFTGDDELNVYWDQVTTPDYTINPRNDFNAWDFVSFGARGGQTDALEQNLYMAFRTKDLLTAQEKSDILTQCNARFGL